MFTNKIKKGTITGLAAGVLLFWLGLSPRVATRLYEAALMPRAHCEHLDELNHLAKVSHVQFRSGAVDLPGRLYQIHDAQKVVFFCGGRRSNLEKLDLIARELSKLGVSVFGFVYRGFGESEGGASLTLDQDALCAYDAMISLGYSADDVVIYGESLGVAVAAYVSAQRSSAALILQSGFSSLGRQIKDMIPVLAMYPSWMYPKHHLNTEESLKRDHPPLLIVHGDDDEVVNVEHAHRLAAAAGDNTTLAILSGAPHKFVYQRDDWAQTVAAFLDSL